LTTKQLLSQLSRRS